MDEEGSDTPQAIKQAGDDKDVGYRRPPARTRFKPGQSGNPAGRPRGARNKSPAREIERAKGIAMEAAYRTIPVMEDGRQRYVTMMEAVWRAAMTKAAKGDSRSIEFVFNTISEIEKEQKLEQMEFLRGAIEYKRDAYTEIEKYTREGKTPPEFYPHPDDIRINIEEGIVEFIGPIEPEHKEIWDIIDANILTEAALTKEIKLHSEIVIDGKKSPAELDHLRLVIKIKEKALKRIADLTKSMPRDQKAWRLRRLMEKIGGENK